MSITEFGADVKSPVPTHLEESAAAGKIAATPAAHPVMAAAADHPAVKVAAASHPAVAALVATHPAVQSLAPHVSNTATAHVEAQGGPVHPAVAANHPAVKKAAESHPAVAALIASHPHVVEHAPEVAKRAAAHAEKHGWHPFRREDLNAHHDSERWAARAYRGELGRHWYSGWGWGSGLLGGYVASSWWPWHWGESRPGRPRRHHWWGRLRSWWTGEPEVIDVYDIDPGLPPPELQDAAYQAVDNYGNGQTPGDSLDDSDLDTGDGDGSGTDDSISG